MTFVQANSILTNINNNNGDTPSTSINSSSNRDDNGSVRLRQEDDCRMLATSEANAVAVGNNQRLVIEDAHLVCVESPSNVVDDKPSSSAGGVRSVSADAAGRGGGSSGTRPTGISVGKKPRAFQSGNAGSGRASKTTTSAVMPPSTSRVVSPLAEDASNRKSVYDNVEANSSSSAIRRRPAVAISRLAVSATSLIGMLGGGAPGGCDSVLLTGNGGLIPRASGNIGDNGNLMTSTALAASCDDVTTISSNAGTSGQQTGSLQQSAAGSKKASTKTTPAISFYRSKSTRSSSGRSSRPASDGGTPASTSLLMRTPTGPGCSGAITGSAGAIGLAAAEGGGGGSSSSNQQIDKNPSTSSKLRALTIPTKLSSTSVGLQSPTSNKSPNSPGPGSCNVTPVGLVTSAASTTSTQQQQQATARFQFGGRPKSSRSSATAAATRVSEPCAMTSSGATGDSTGHVAVLVRDQCGNVDEYCKREATTTSGNQCTGSDEMSPSTTNASDSRGTSSDATEARNSPLELSSPSSVESSADVMTRDDIANGCRQASDKFQQVRAGFERRRHRSDPDDDDMFRRMDANAENGLDDALGSMISVEQSDSSTGSTATIVSVVTRCPSVQSHLKDAASVAVNSPLDAAVGTAASFDERMELSPTQEKPLLSGNLADETVGVTSSMAPTTTGSTPMKADGTYDNASVSINDGRAASSINDVESKAAVKPVQSTTSDHMTSDAHGTGDVSKSDKNGNCSRTFQG